MQPNIYNFFKFLEVKENRPIPFMVKFIYAPETLTPQELNVEGNLDLSNNEKLKTLPKGLTVEGNLRLINCSSLEKLLEGLTVGKNLNLSYCTSLKTLPEGLIVGGNLYLKDTPLSEQTDEKIRAGRNINGKIYR